MMKQIHDSSIISQGESTTGDRQSLKKLKCGINCRSSRRLVKNANYVKQGQHTHNGKDSGLGHKQTQLIEEMSENQPQPFPS